MPDTSSASSRTPDPAPPGPPEDRGAVVADLVLAVLEAGRVTRGLGEAVNKHTGIHRANYLTLLRIQEFDRSRISDIAAGLELDVSVISRKIAALDELGLVSRSPHPDDGRAQVVSVTELGRATIAENRRIYTEAVGRLTADWDTDDLATLAAGLHRLGSHRPEAAVADTAEDAGADADGGASTSETADATGASTTTTDTKDR
ncbi:MarR family winged helix-turn-helix transcriptional regulator [Georgenia sp. Z1491]|uniref:MarR family winged helix-turn-helix transcriptional regulator n=1 Tax=Georgenia sp. Z1491 TaxID=3416707 RepID=UPI003CF97C6E